MPRRDDAPWLPEESAEYDREPKEEITDIEEYSRRLARNRHVLRPSDGVYRLEEGGWGGKEVREVNNRPFVFGRRWRKMDDR